MAMQNQAGSQAYLRTKVMTASPAELRLMLLDGAIRFAEQAKRGYETKDYELSFEGTTKAQAIVLELLEKETGETYPELAEKTSLREGLNLDSLDMAGLVLHVESRFGIQIETELLERIATVGDMLDVLEEKLAAKAGRQAA